MDPVQRLWHDGERAVPHIGAQVPWMQLLQHPADEGRSSCMLQSLRTSHEKQRNETAVRRGSCVIDRSISSRPVLAVGRKEHPVLHMNTISAGHLYC
jgi:hypothetical protein